MSKIKSIKRKRITTQRLYNLSVENDETFIADGIVVHNCKSSIEPIVKGELKTIKGRNGKKGTDAIEDFKPSTKKIEDTIQFADIETACDHACQHKCQIHL